MIDTILFLLHVVSAIACAIITVIVWRRMSPGERWSALNPPASIEEALMGRVWDATLWFLILANILVWILVGVSIFKWGLKLLDIVGLSIGIWGVLLGLRQLWKEK